VVKTIRAIPLGYLRALSIYALMMAPALVFIVHTSALKPIGAFLTRESQEAWTSSRWSSATSFDGGVTPYHSEGPSDPAGRERGGESIGAVGAIKNKPCP
jgi:hypothetical protein